MSALTFDILMDNALSLPREERSLMANRLIESIDEDESVPHEQWRAELKRRVDDIESGRVIPLTLDQFRDQLDQRLA